jgi:mannose-1-phosphate guanylyltransferase
MADRHLYALIMAGGSGTRLWPLSRSNRPKQLLNLVGGRTMLQQAYDRLLALVPPENILVATNREYAGEVRDQLPELPADNILGEPEGRGTASAIGLGGTLIAERDPGAIMIVVTADHVIARVGAFQAALRAATLVARGGYLVTLGIQPTFPSTGLGYIERADRLDAAEGLTAYRVARFVEKPDRERAEAFLEAGAYSWNSGMFIWPVELILDAFRRFMPDLSAGLEEIYRAVGTAGFTATVDRVWPTLPKQTIDYGVMEKADRVAVIPVDIGWSDVGSWPSVYDELAHDLDGNAAVGRVVSIDTRGSLLYAPERLVAAIGLEDMIVVATDDVVLICPMSRAQEVRDLVAKLKEQGEGRYL